MQLKNILCCDLDLIRFISKSHLKDDNGTFMTLSVTEKNKLELMIFLGIDESESEYEVRVYKNDVSDKYLPNKNDNVKHYKENYEYATFFFDEYEDANRFIYLLGYLHPEYKKRPVRVIDRK